MNKLKKYLFCLILLELFLAYTPAMAQQASSTAAAPDCAPNAKVYDYRCAKVSSQIEKFLCAPKPQDASQTPGSGRNQDQAAFNNSNNSVLFECINKIYRFSIVLAAVVGVFFIVIGGYVYMSAEGNQESIDKAKNILVTTITSIVILFAGYILLKAINPDLIEFHSIQPESIKLSHLPDWQAILDKNGNIVEMKSSAGSFKPLGNNDVSKIDNAGCGFQDPARFRKEAAGLQTNLFDALVEICRAGAATKGIIQISSVASGEHSQNPPSYHYKFCAVDFADGSGNFRNTAAGKAAEAKARSMTNVIKNVNPGVDRNEYDHLHIDIGATCQN